MNVYLPLVCFRNGAWGENGPHDMNSAPWGDEKITPWNEPNMASWNSSQKPKTPMTPGGWTDGEVDPASWGHASKMVGNENLFLLNLARV